LVNSASARLFRVRRWDVGRAPNMGIIMPELGMTVKDELPLYVSRPRGR
jgi:hypothetical protein